MDEIIHIDAPFGELSVIKRDDGTYKVWVDEHIIASGTADDVIRALGYYLHNQG